MFPGQMDTADRRGSRGHLLSSGLLRSALELHQVMRERQRLKSLLPACGLYRRSGIAPCPEGVFNCEDYSELRCKCQTPKNKKQKQNAKNRRRKKTTKDTWDHKGTKRLWKGRWTIDNEWLKKKGHDFYRALDWVEKGYALMMATSATGQTAWHWGASK
jgi:hypothetical protein